MSTNNALANGGKVEVICNICIAEKQTLHLSYAQHLLRRCLNNVIPLELIFRRVLPPSFFVATELHHWKLEIRNHNQDTDR